LQTAHLDQGRIRFELTAHTDRVGSPVRYDQVSYGVVDVTVDRLMKVPTFKAVQPMEGGVVVKQRAE
jgi:hypothetical protein